MVPKLGRKTLSEHRGVISMKSEEVALKDWIHVGSIRLNYDLTLEHSHISFVFVCCRHKSKKNDYPVADCPLGLKNP